MAMYRLLPADKKMELFRSTKFADLHSEAELEDWLEHNLDVLTEGESLLPIGRQLSNPLSGTLDLLALDADGNVVVIELKRRKAPRDAIAQALEYVAWAAGQSHEALVTRADRYLSPRTLAQRWAEMFIPASMETGDDSPTELPADLRLNRRQRVFLVVEGYSERIMTVAQYLRRSGTDFNLVTFHYYRIDSGEEMIDFETIVGPTQDQVTVTTPDKAGRDALNSEEATVAGWSSSMQSAFDIFREMLLSLEEESLQIEPKARGITFRKQMPDESKPIYVCTFEPSRGKKDDRVTVSIKKPSLEGYLDIDGVVRGIEADKPDEVTLSNKKEWLTLWFAPAPEPARQIAELIYRHIVAPLV